MEENGAIASFKGKKVWPTQKIAALRIFFLERFGILPKETSGMLFAVEMQAGHEDQLFRLPLFVKRVAVAVPGGRQSFGTVVIEKLLHDLLPAELAQNVLIELRPIFPQHFLK